MRSIVAVAGAVMLIVLGLVLPLPVRSATIRVPADQPTIQAGINAAGNGDTVLVAPGTYVENFGPHQSVVIRSEGGADVTTIVGVTGFAPPEMTYDHFIEIAGFTFRDRQGMAVFIRLYRSFMTFRLRDCRFLRNGGQGLPLAKGAVYIWADDSFGSDVEIANCWFEENRSLGWGGAISIEGVVSGSIQNNDFVRNVAVWGGGIGAGSVNRFQSFGMLLIEGNRFEDNIATGDGGNTGDGGGVVVFASSEVQVVDNVFINNEADLGGAVMIKGSSTEVALARNLMGANRASDLGGGIAIKESTVEVNHNTLVEGSGVRGGGIGAQSPIGTISVFNNIVAKTTLGSGVYYMGIPAGIVTGCNDVWDANPLFEGVTPAATDFSADPEFCDTAEKNYGISASSPCTPDNSPSGCGLVGAFPIGCGLIGVPIEQSPPKVQALTVTPNPVRGVARFETGQVVAPLGLLNIFDSQGRLVEQLKSDNGHWQWAPRASVPAGVYFAMPGVAHVESEAVKFLYLR